VIIFSKTLIMCQTQGVGPSGEGLGLEGLLPSRFKVQHLMGANCSLGPSD
jgi:hypothetical protein